MMDGSMWHLAMYGCILALMALGSLIAWVLARIVTGRWAPFGRICRSSLTGYLAATVGFWGVDIIKFIYDLW